MVKAWFMSSDFTDPKLENHLNPPKYVSLQDLYQASGVEYFKINVDTYETDGLLEGIRKERGYSYDDVMTCSEKCTENLEEKLKIFFAEHLHTDEEIRLVLEGSGYFDVRDKNDQWIRIEVLPGDMLVLPSGIFHRFTLDKKMFIKAKRFFIGKPVWVAHNRPSAENMGCRLDYLKQVEAGFISAK